MTTTMMKMMKMTMKMMTVVVMMMVLALALLAAAKDDPPMPEAGQTDADFYAGVGEDPLAEENADSKECKKALAEWKKRNATPEKFAENVKKDSAAPELERVEGMQAFLTCSGWDEECQSAVSSIVGATCFYEIEAISQWFVSSGVLKNKPVNATGTSILFFFFFFLFLRLTFFFASSLAHMSGIEEALGPCCDGKLSDACCVSLSSMIAQYGRVGWRAGCLCEKQAVERMFGDDSEEFVKQIAEVVKKLGCDQMEGSAKQRSDEGWPDDLSVWPQC